MIVDETSMVSLSQMARLLEAVRPQARLVLVGDPGQLTSIEAGAVLGDIVGPADDGPPSAGIVVLSRVHRFGGAIGAVAEAVRRGDADAAVQALSTSPDEVTWLPVDPETDSALAPVHDGAVAAARAVIEAAREGDAHRALEALGSFRVLCAHRRGPYGVATWTDRIERWLANEVDGFGAEGQWYVGRPLLVTENDYGLRLYNGDTGVVVATDTGRVSAAFERRGELIEFSPTRLAAVDSVYAMTVHKSQGSQFAAAAVLLPDPTSQILTRELLYTAVTRARERLILVGTEEAVRAAVARPVARASGLRWRLWGNEGVPDEARRPALTTPRAPGRPARCARRASPVAHRPAAPRHRSGGRRDRPGSRRRAARRRARHRGPARERRYGHRTGLSNPACDVAIERDAAAANEHAELPHADRADADAIGFRDGACPRGGQPRRIGAPPDPRVGVQHDHRAASHSTSSGAISSSSSTLKVTLPCRSAGGSAATTSATGCPCLVMTISSPAAASSRSARH